VKSHFEQKKYKGGHKNAPQCGPEAKLPIFHLKTAKFAYFLEK